MRTIEHWIDGRTARSASERTALVWDPATGAQQGQVDLADVATVDAAVASAVKAGLGWRETSLSARTKVLFTFRDLVEKAAPQLAEVISAEHGKTHSDALGEIQRGLEVVEFACGAPELLKGAHSAQVSTSIDVHSTLEPLGVCAGITPFNFPAMVPMWMFPLAIACGNSFVLKPSERDPSASLLIADLWQQAGLPDGVFNVVQGDKTAVDRLLTHADVAAVSFVGSTPIAKYVHATASAAGKRVQALGGAKNHAVVLPDADMGYVADQLTGAAFGSAGQRCMAISIAVAVGDAHLPLLDALADRASKVKVGPGSDPTTEMGPVVTADARNRIVDLIGSGVEQGARLVLDGRDPGVEPSDGFWVGPTLFTDVQPDMQIYTEEVFGPVLGVVHVDTLTQAINLINRSPYANGTALFTRDGEAGRIFERGVEVGMVGINVPVPVPVAFHSFGGWRDSLFGDTHIYGREGVHFYTRSKIVTSRWNGAGNSRVDYDFPSSK